LGFDWYDKHGEFANDKILIDDAIWKKGPDQAERVRDAMVRIDYTQPLTGGPTDHGFDDFSGVDLPNMPPYAWIEQNRLPKVPSVPKPKEMFGHDGPMVPGWRLEDILPEITDKAMTWLEVQSKEDKPFFLYLSLTSPHTPIVPSKLFQGASVNRYADFVVENDWVVGRVMWVLEEMGVADNTLVIFTTDNGTAAACNFGAMKRAGVDLKVNFRAQKGTIYDGGHRVPFIARWPGVIEAGTTNDALICLNDVMATTAELLDVDLPDDAAEDSHSILPLLTGEATSLPDRPAVVHHDYRGNFAIRRGKWKLIAYDKPELYDMDADPKETTNLIKQQPEVAEGLAALLRSYKDSGRSRD
jgi:arylsulfatase A-like enzyme